jgi:uncharacterized protein
MRLAVLSDIHDHLEHLRAVLQALRTLRPDALILCGDLTTPKILSQCRSAAPDVTFCLGNCDQHNAVALRSGALELGIVPWDSVGIYPLDHCESVAFAHFPHTARAAALSGGHRAVFYGHTHKPAEERLELEQGGRVLLANPGDVQGRFGRVGGLLWNSRTGRCTWFEA